MKIVHSETARRRGGSPHRPDGIGFICLFSGDERSPDNYWLALGTTVDYSTPRHRHNFDQVRIMVSGEFDFGRGYLLDAGKIGYFCEGSFYEQHSVGKAEALVLQMGGASGSGYMSLDEVYAGSARLAQRGSFKDGVFTSNAGDARKVNQDGYEAVWEDVHQRPITYPKPRYMGPVVMDPEAFQWLPLDGAEGVFERHFGTFHERGAAISQIMVEPGRTCSTVSEPSVTLYFIFDGSGSLEGQSIKKHSAVQLDKGEVVSFTAESRLHIQRFRLPAF
ncbi:MAG TPA: hypothetical protein VNT30_04725 [Stellaceae bacterium]|nr:hypothetical protein [Stellaceae bacterium]